MSISHHISAIALMLFVIRGDICTSYYICNSYATLENIINERTKTDRENCRSMVLEIFHGGNESYKDWDNALYNVLEWCCDALGKNTEQAKNEIENYCKDLPGSTTNIHLNEICHGRTVSTFLASEIGAFQWFYPQETWNLTEDCSNATKLLREDCFATERNTTDMSIGFDEGAENVASRMGKAMEKCMFRRNFCEGNPCSETSKKWKLYVLILEFLERIHPRVECGQDGYTSIKT